MLLVMSIISSCEWLPFQDRRVKLSHKAVKNQTLRRDCLDHVLIFGERHLRRVLTSVYYNETRTHLGLGKDAPLGRAVERFGTVAAIPVLCGLHHRYARI